MKNITFTDYQDCGGAVKLPVLNGYTVDMRCREFRKVYWTRSGDPKEIEFIEFDSEQGEELLVQLIQIVPKGGRLWDEIKRIF